MGRISRPDPPRVDHRVSAFGARLARPRITIGARDRFGQGLPSRKRALLSFADCTCAGAADRLSMTGAPTPRAGDDQTGCATCSAAS